MNKNRIRGPATCELPLYSPYELLVMRAKGERVSQIAEEYLLTF